MNLRDKRPSIEAAWRGYRDLVMGPNAGRDETLASRLAFWAGASVLFYTITGMLDEGEDATDADLAKMDAIHAEVEKFCTTFDEAVIQRHGGRQ
jgi:hypothetical protein